MNKDQIKKQKLKPVPVENCDWGVFIKKITLSERKDLLAKISNEDSIANTLVLVVTGCCDEKGNLLFDESDKEWLVDKHYLDLELIATTFLENNGLTTKKVEAAKKN